MVTPTHQSPTNAVLSLERRLSLLEWAHKQGSWIIEDDYDGEFHYQGRPLPALKSLDSQERVVYCGTFSKTLFPALRLSYIVVPPSAIERFKSTANILGNQCSVWQQQATSQFINDGHFLRHLRKMRNLYRQRKYFLIEAISEVLPNIFEIQPQSGGIHILVKLVNGKSTGDYVKLANEYGLKIESLNEWSIKNKVSPFLLLGFTNIKSKLEAVSLCDQLRIIDSKLF
nr:PLP-dependent aminotransferase family protein [Providencia stuartii]